MSFRRQPVEKGTAQRAAELCGIALNKIFPSETGILAAAAPAEAIARNFTQIKVVTAIRILYDSEYFAQFLAVLPGAELCLYSFFHYQFIAVCVRGRIAAQRIADPVKYSADFYRKIRHEIVGRLIQSRLIGIDLVDFDGQCIGNEPAQNFL